MEQGHKRYRFEFHEDGGHGWLKVPWHLIRSLEVEVSRYSYCDGSHVYLEEDCDAPRFDAAFKRRMGHDIRTNGLIEIYDGPDSPIRKLARYDASVCHCKPCSDQRVPE